MYKNVNHLKQNLLCLKRAIVEKVIPFDTFPFKSV